MVCVARGLLCQADGIYFYNQDDDEDQEGQCRICFHRSTVVGLCRRLKAKGWSAFLNVVDARTVGTQRLLLDEELFNGAPAAAASSSLLTLGSPSNRVQGTEKRCRLL